LKCKEIITSESILETAFRVFPLVTIIYYSHIYGFCNIGINAIATF